MGAFVLHIPENKLRVVAPDVGGGFGSKIYHYAEEAIVTWAAGKVRRPVKWTADRSESFMSDAHGRDHVSTAEMALDNGGHFLGAARPHAGEHGRLPVDLRALRADLPLCHTVGRRLQDPSDLLQRQGGVHQHRAGRCLSRRRTTGGDVPAGTPGRCDRARYRSRSRRVAAEEFHPRRCLPLPDAGRPAVRQRRLPDDAEGRLEDRRLGWFRGSASGCQGTGKLRGIGISTYLEACGIAPSAVVGSLGARAGLYEVAEIRVHPTGSVTVFTGTHSHGQGHETTLAQLVVSQLGVPFDQVEVVHGDTAKIPFGMGTYGSRSLAVGGSAMVKAMDKVIAKGKKIAAHLMEAAVEDIEFADNKFTVAGTDKSKTLTDISLAAYVPHNYPIEELEPGLDETAFYDPKNFTFPGGCHIAEVEIDPETGVVEMVNFTAVDDVGRVVNPMIVEGQVQGGVAQGIGQALLEAAAYDPSGQLLSGSFMDYTMPRANDIPNMSVATENTMCTHNPLGSKGCGEVGAIGSPPAVINAVVDALKEYGIRHLDMPATGAKLWSIIQSATGCAE